MRMSLHSLRGAWSNLLGYAWNHPMARHDRIGTYRRIFGWQLATSIDRRPRVMAWVNGAQLSVGKGMAGATGNIYYGLHEFADMAFFVHFLRPEDTFADIGANVGTYTILAGKVCGAQVHSFEPADETIGQLRTNIALNGLEQRVTLHAVALGKQPGKSYFTRNRDATNQFATGAGDHQEVVVSTADAELADLGVTAIKVDVEGAEDQVFAGATALLGQRQLQAIEVETLRPGVREAIEQAGFVERWYDPFNRSLSSAVNGMRPNNHLFVRDEALVADRVRGGVTIKFGRQSI